MTKDEQKEQVVVNNVDLEETVEQESPPYQFVQREKEFRPLEVVLQPGEPIDRAIKRLAKKVKREGNLELLRKRQYHIKKSEKKHKAKMKQDFHYKCLREQEASKTDR